MLRRWFVATQDVFSAEELARLRGVPEINRAELIRYFTLTGADEAFVRQFRTARNVLGVAVQLCTLPWLGFVPDEVALAPDAAVGRLSQRLGIAMGELRGYGAVPAGLRVPVVVAGDPARGDPAAAPSGRGPDPRSYGDVDAGEASAHRPAVRRVGPAAGPGRLPRPHAAGMAGRGADVVERRGGRGRIERWAAAGVVAAAHRLGWSWPNRPSGNFGTKSSAKDGLGACLRGDEASGLHRAAWGVPGPRQPAFARGYYVLTPQTGGIGLIVCRAGDRRGRRSGFRPAAGRLQTWGDSAQRALGMAAAL